MRKRRGAIHSNDEEQYIQLSILSEKTMGIFYNDTPKSQKQETIEKDSDWSGFDFNHQNKMKIQEIQQQEQESGKRQITNVMLIYQRGQKISQLFQTHFMNCINLPNSFSQQNQTLQLIIKQIQSENKILKFWLTSLDYQNMLQCHLLFYLAYYRMSDIFILLAMKQHKEKIEKHLKIIQTIKAQKKYSTYQIIMSESQNEFKQELQQIIKPILNSK